MVAYRLVFLAGAVAALPLNINLGAYSPAIVVGDGEISFGGNQDVSKLMTTLEGAAVTAANGAAANTAAQGQAQGGTGAAAGKTEGAAQAPAAGQQPQAAAVGQPQAASLEQNQSEPAAIPATTSGSTTDTTLTDQAQQIAALQGMGKAVVARDVATDDAGVAENEEPSTVFKRDLASFDRALKYAEAALTKGPKIQLGTGAEGSGVGILVDNNQQAAARTGTRATARKVKRDLSSGSKVKVTTMYVRSGIPASLQNGNRMTARDVDENANVPRVETIQIAPAKREANPNPNAIDAVNLNVNGENGVTLTFVETVEDGEDSEDV